MARPKIDVMGQRFGKLVVVGEAPRRSWTRRVFWQCQCDCGGSCQLESLHLRNGRRLDCGCVALEKRRETRIGMFLARPNGWTEARKRMFVNEWHDMSDSHLAGRLNGLPGPHITPCAVHALAEKLGFRKRWGRVQFAPRGGHPLREDIIEAAEMLDRGSDAAEIVEYFGWSWEQFSYAIWAISEREEVVA